MPQLTFAMAPDGLPLPALVGLDAATVQQLAAQGQPPPSLIQVRCQIDTATTVTAVVPSILTALGAIPGRPGQTHSASGRTSVRSHLISFTVFDPTGINLATLTRTIWQVTDLPQDLPDVDVLFGRDLVRQLVLHIDGPANKFTLVF